MANKPSEANFFPDVPVYPEMGTFQPVYGKFDLTTYIQGASDYEIMAFLVGKYNACLEAYGTVTKLSTDTITACKQLQDWINSWFDNLDVQEELNKKIDSMVQDGSFETLLHKTFDTQINQQTTSAVTAWLVANVTPTGSAVVVDKSLSIAGAAADAKTVGDIGLIFKGVIEPNSNLDLITKPGTYISDNKSTNLSGTPFNYATDNGAYLFVLNVYPYGQGIYQIIEPFSIGANSPANVHNVTSVYTRTIATNGVASGWVDINAANILSANSNLNLITKPGTYISDNKSTNLSGTPFNYATDNGAYLFVLNVYPYGQGIYQIIEPFSIGANSPANVHNVTSVYTRTIATNGVASGWVDALAKADQFHFKNWAVIGDSRSAPSFSPVGGHYYEQIAGITGIAYNSVAVSGARLTQMSKQIDNITSTPDLITVMGGINDWGQQNPTDLGSLSDTDNTSVYGAIRTIITTALSKFPNAYLVFITPVPCANTVSITGWGAFGLNANSKNYHIYDVWNAIEEVCKQYNVPVLHDGDAGGYSPLISEQNTLYFQDGLHMNKKGQTRCANNVLKFIANLNTI